jgi:hypothetical protein
VITNHVCIITQEISLTQQQIDWSLVSMELGITNGHAARMRYSRFKQQMEGNVPVRRAPRNPNNSVKRESKKKRERVKTEVKTEDNTGNNTSAGNSPLTRSSPAFTNPDGSQESAPMTPDGFGGVGVADMGTGLGLGMGGGGGGGGGKRIKTEPSAMDQLDGGCDPTLSFASATAPGVTTLGSSPETVVSLGQGRTSNMPPSPLHHPDPHAAANGAGGMMPMSALPDFHAGPYGHPSQRGMYPMPVPSMADVANGHGHILMTQNGMGHHGHAGHQPGEFEGYLNMGVGPVGEWHHMGPAMQPPHMGMVKVEEGREWGYQA